MKIAMSVVFRRRRHRGGRGECAGPGGRSTSSRSRDARRASRDRAHDHLRIQRAGHEREAVVYTPPAYESSTESYPVLYLLHGAGGNPTTWTERELAHVRLQLVNLASCATATGRRPPADASRGDQTPRRVGRRRHRPVGPRGPREPFYVRPRSDCSTPVLR
jgi:hypothetical protein